MVVAPAGLPLRAAERGHAVSNVLDLGAGTVPLDRYHALHLRLLLRLVGARAPRADDANAQDITSTPARFGAFRLGDIVRVHATGNAWLLFGDAGVTARAGEGVPLAAWDARDFVVTEEHARHVSIAYDGEEPFAPPYALAWRVGNVLQEGV